MPASPAVTVAICTHDGAKLLPETLAHLAAQKTAPDLKWEVLLIDNASTDDSAGVATRCWPADAPAPLRIAHEARLGLTHARERALDEARYEVVSFVDDDNWVCERWVERAAEVMAEHPEVAICGGVGEAVPEAPLPAWFERYQTYFAIGSAGGSMGDMRDPIGMVFGAGLTMRKSAWDAMRQQGFRLLTSIGAEDHELCLAARLAGWRVWLDPELRFRHFLPARRLTWDYFRSLMRARCDWAVPVDPYFQAIDGRPDGLAGGLKRTWAYNFLNALRCLVQNALRRPLKMLRRSSPALEGDADVMRFEMQMGRVIGLWRYRKDYAANLRMVEQARWRSERRVRCA